MKKIIQIWVIIIQDKEVKQQMKMKEKVNKMKKQNKYFKYKFVQNLEIQSLLLKQLILIEKR